MGKRYKTDHWKSYCPLSWTDTYVRTFFLFLSSYTKLAFAGSSSDQDGMMCRYTDTDSGLGRATPPRRAPSPGMGSMRHLPSPSGPGSLPPGLMTKRRVFDDGSSDISSTPSSMMDYNGKQIGEHFSGKRCLVSMGTRCSNTFFFSSK